MVNDPKIIRYAPAKDEKVDILTPSLAMSRLCISREAAVVKALNNWRDKLNANRCIRHSHTSTISICSQ